MKADRNIEQEKFHEFLDKLHDYLEVEIQYNANLLETGVPCEKNYFKGRKDALEKLQSFFRL